MLEKASSHALGNLGTELSNVWIAWIIRLSLYLPVKIKLIASLLPKCRGRPWLAFVISALAHEEFLDQQQLQGYAHQSFFAFAQEHQQHESLPRSSLGEYEEIVVRGAAADSRLVLWKTCVSDHLLLPDPSLATL